MKTYMMLPMLAAATLGLSACSSSSAPANTVEADNAINGTDTLGSDNIDAGAANDLDLSETANGSGNAL